MRLWNIYTMIPGDDAWIMSGLNRATAEIILGLSARDIGTFRYHGRGKLPRHNSIGSRNSKLRRMFFRKWDKKVFICGLNSHMEGALIDVNYLGLNQIKCIASSWKREELESFTFWIQSIWLHKTPLAVLHELLQPWPVCEIPKEQLKWISLSWEKIYVNNGNPESNYWMPHYF